MSNTPKPQAYRPAQIIPHWVVVVGIIVQMVISESMVRVFRS